MSGMSLPKKMTSRISETAVAVTVTMMASTRVAKHTTGKKMDVIPGCRGERRHPPKNSTAHLHRRRSCVCVRSFGDRRCGGFQHYPLRAAPHCDSRLGGNSRCFRCQRVEKQLLPTSCASSLLGGYRRGSMDDSSSPMRGRVTTTTPTTVFRGSID